MVEGIRVAEEALGGVRYGGSEEERKRGTFRRSVFVAAFGRDAADALANARAAAKVITPDYV
jgi:hypothetical protein